MPRIERPEDIEYISFAGGGGRGVTYLGVVRALEEMRVLPLNIDRPGGNQLRGISGASAGAITALVLSMGATHDELERILNRSQDFIRFFDPPNKGYFKGVDRYNMPFFRTDARQSTTSRDAILRNDTEFINSRVEALRRGLRLPIPLIGPMVSTPLIGEWIIRSLVMFGLFRPESPIATQLLSAPQDYFYNLIYDGGLFPGVPARTFIVDKIHRYLGNRIRETFGGGSSTPVHAGNINFYQFNQLTGIELVLTGTNISRHKPAMFSERLTPDFPVAEAVGISMNLPIIFKPVRVDIESPPDYNGLWVDGGVLNNSPIHAFDYREAPCSENCSNLKPLNQGVLGFNLRSPLPSNEDADSDPFFNFKRLAVDLTETFLYSSNEGQLRSEEEAEQTINLNTFRLSTYDFAPPRSERDRAARAAYEDTYRYFRMRSRR